MDFEQQVNQAIHRSQPSRWKQRIGLSVVVAMGILATAAVFYLLHAKHNIRTECRRLQSELKTAAETTAQSQSRIDELTSQLEQARKEIVELNQQNHILSIQTGELKIQSEKSKSLAEQLTDANTELDQAQARIKALTAELELLRKANGSSYGPVARQGP